MDTTEEAGLACPPPAVEKAVDSSRGVEDSLAVRSRSLPPRYLPTAFPTAPPCRAFFPFPFRCVPGGSR